MASNVIAAAAAPHTVEITTTALNKLILWSYPSIIGQAIILLESLRIIPAEVRIWSRIWKRRRFNAAEMMFLAIKYFAILGYTCDAIVHSSTWLKTGKACYDTHYVSLFCIFFATSLVALAIAWRTYIIFQCKRKVYWILCIALCIQVSLSMWTMSVQYKYTTLRDGYCVTGHPTSYFKISTIKLLLPWYLLYNSLYDFSVTAAATRHLVKTTGAPFGFSRVSRVLFLNNVHYVLVVCSANFILAVLFWSTPRGLPSLLPVSAALQIIAGMNLLTIEQDLVHRPMGGRTSNNHVPSSGSKGSPGSLPTSSAISGNSWQVSSGKYQTSTMQSDTSSSSCGGSPLLQSLWSKKKADNTYHGRSVSDLAVTPPTGAITFEQNKIRFYDDGSSPSPSPREKKYRKAGWRNRTGSPAKSEKEFDQEHDDVFATQGELPPSEELSPQSQKQDGSFCLSSVHSQSPPSFNHTRDQSMRSDQIHFEPVYTTPTKVKNIDHGDLPVLGQGSFPETTSTPISTPGGGCISIRSIRANLAATTSSPSLDAQYNAADGSPVNSKKPLLHQRPQTSPVSTSHPRRLGSSPELLVRGDGPATPPSRPKQPPTLLFDLTSGCTATSLQDQPYGRIPIVSPLTLRQSSSRSTVQRRSPPDAFWTSPGASMHIPSTKAHSSTSTPPPTAHLPEVPGNTAGNRGTKEVVAAAAAAAASPPLLSLRPSDFRKSRSVRSQATVLEFDGTCDGTCDETDTDLDRSSTVGDEMGTISFARRTQLRISGSQPACR